MSGYFWGGLSEGFLKGYSLGQRIGAKRDIEQMNTEKEFDLGAAEQDKFATAGGLSADSEQGQMLWEQNTAFADDAETFRGVNQATADSLGVNSIGLRQGDDYISAMNAENAELGAGPALTNARAPVDRIAMDSVNPDNIGKHRYLGKTFDGQLSPYDRTYARQSRLAEIYGSRGLFDEAARAESAALDASGKGAELKYRDSRDAVLDNRYAAEQGYKRERAAIDDARWQYEQDMRGIDRAESNYQFDTEMGFRNRQQDNVERNSRVQRQVSQNQDFRDHQRNTMAIYKHNQEYFDWFQTQDEKQKLAEVDRAFFDAMQDPRGFDRLFDLAAPTFNNPNVKDTDGNATRADDGTPLFVSPNGKPKDARQWWMKADPLTRRAYAGVMHQYARAAVTGKYDEATAAWASLQKGLAETSKGGNGLTKDTNEYYTRLTSDLDKYIGMLENARNDDEAAAVQKHIDATIQEIANVRVAQSGRLQLPEPNIPVGTPVKEGDAWFLMGENGNKIPAMYDKKAGRVVPAPEPDDTPDAPQQTEQTPAPTGGLTKPNAGTGRPGRETARSKVSDFRRQEKFEDRAGQVIDQIKNAASYDEAMRIYETNKEFLADVSRGTVMTNYITAAEYQLRQRRAQNR